MRNKPFTYPDCRAVVVQRRGLAAALRAAILVALVAVGAEGAMAAAEGTGLRDWTRVRLQANKMLVASAQSTIERWPEGVVWVENGLRYLGTERTTHGIAVRGRDRGLPIRWAEFEAGRRGREFAVDRSGKITMRRYGIPAGKKDGWTGAWVEGEREAKHTLAPEALSSVTCGGPIDAWTLLARLDCLVGAPETRIQLVGRDGAHAVIARVVDRRQGRMSLRDLDGGPTRVVSGEQVRVQLLPAPGGPDPSVFGMDGGISLWIDVASGAPVEIEGRREGIPGTIRFRLDGVGKSKRPVPTFPWPSESKSAAALPPR